MNIRKMFNVIFHYKSDICPTKIFGKCRKLKEEIIFSIAQLSRNNDYLTLLLCLVFCLIFSLMAMIIFYMLSYILYLSPIEIPYFFPSKLYNIFPLPDNILLSFLKHPLILCV